MEGSRTQNSIKNVKSGAIIQIINKLTAFIVRTFFIKILNEEYLGVNGLFTNVLTILSFAELGIGTAIIFNMYRPVAEKDNEKIKSLMLLYKKAYNIIFFVVLFFGILLIPFLKYLINDIPQIKENIIIIYILFLFNSAISYLFTYKRSIISAHQQENVLNLISGIFYIGKSLLQIIFLYITKKYLLFLLIQIIGTVLENLYISYKANKMYPYLKEKNVEKLSDEEKKGIFSNVKNLVIYKLGTVIMSGTDNLLISILINVGTVGFVSNYIMIIDAVKSVITTSLNGIIASVGNLNVVGTSDRKEKVFYEITFVDYVVYSFSAVAFMVLLNPFIKIWLGNKYLLNNSVSIALAVSFFIDGLRNPGFTYRTTLGLFKKGRITPYLGSITNVIFSIVLCKFIGVTGIFVATSISQLVSYVWIDPYIIHKHEFKTPFKKYIFKYCKYLLSFILCAIISIYTSNMILINGLGEIAIKAIIVIILPNIINLILYRNSEEFKSLFNKVVRPLINRQ